MGGKRISVRENGESHNVTVCAKLIQEDGVWRCSIYYRRPEECRYQQCYDQEDEELIAEFDEEPDLDQLAD